jgi:hypothetical protein
MAWTTPSTQSTGDLITAAIWNNEVPNNVTYLHGSLGGVVTRILNPTTSYTAPTNATCVNAEAVGSGGGGGGTPVCSSGQSAAAAGGGGGSAGIKNLTTNIGTHTVGVGAGGSGVSNSTGQTGGSTTFKDTTSVTVAIGGGGIGGTVGVIDAPSGPGGSGDTSPTGDFQMAGQPGCFGISNVSLPTNFVSGMGGAAGNGTAGGASRNNTGVGFVGNTGGGGGGGAAGGASAAVQTGGAGGNGVINVTAYG